MEPHDNPALDALDADELFMLGTRASGAGSAAEALAYLKLATARDPAHARAHWALAAEYASLRMPDRARSHFGQALALLPGQPVLRFQYGLLCLTLGDVAQAEALWLPLDELAPSAPLRLFKEGLLDMVRDRFDEALVLIRQAMADPGVEPALRQDMAMTIERIEAARSAGAPAGEPPPEAAPQELPIETQLAFSAYGGSGGRH